MTTPKGLGDTKWVEAILAKAQQVASDPFRFGVYRDDPEGFVRDVLGVTLWEKQLDVLRAARDFPRVAVRSGHGVGKTFSVACLVVWWLYARRGLVITTAPTWEHVEGVLWREINALKQRALVPLPGEPLQTELRIDNTWYAIGLSTNTPSAFQGRHHPDLLVVVDEAPGVSEQVHLEISTLATGARNRIVMIGNPTATVGTFYNAFKQPDVWHLLRISCFDHPNVVSGEEGIVGAVTRGWIEKARRQWGENSPFWYSRVLGEFPRISNRGTIPLGWVERARNDERRKKALEAAEKARLPKIGGLDVARYGENACVLIVRHGDAVETVESWSHTTLTETAGMAKRMIAKYGLRALVVDASGIGAGVYDMLAEQGEPVTGYNGGHAAFTRASFGNRRSEMWWHLRSRFEKERLWLPQLGEAGDSLAADLVTPEYDVMSTGRIRVETKEQLLKRNIPSPDFGDALVLCFALEPDPDAELVDPTPPRGRDHTTAEQILGVGSEEAPFQQLPAGF